MNLEPTDFSEIKISLNELLDNVIDKVKNPEFSESEKKLMSEKKYDKVDSMKKMLEGIIEPIKERLDLIIGSIEKNEKALLDLIAAQRSIITQQNLGI